MDGTWYYWHLLYGCWKKHSMKWLLQRYLLKQLIVETSGGPVSGLLSSVGSDYLELIEASGDLVLVPLESVESFTTTS